MCFAVKISITAAFIFFIAGLFAGIWKYRIMMISENSSSRYYVDSAHRTSFMYAFASLMLGVFAYYSVFPCWINSIAAAVTLGFFASAVTLNFINGFKGETSNQIRESKNRTPGYAPAGVVKVYMALLIIFEIIGSSILGIGALLGVWL